MFPNTPNNFVNVQKVAMGLNFVMFLSNGLIFSMGSENSFGELGQGDNEPRFAPEIILSLRNLGEKIEQVECG